MECTEYNDLCFFSQLKRNVLNVNFHISHYTKIIEELRGEVRELKDKLKGFEDGSVKPPEGVPVAQSCTTDNHNELKR